MKCVAKGSKLSVSPDEEAVLSSARSTTGRFDLAGAETSQNLVE
jgi:hypothetical protein